MLSLATQPKTTAVAAFEPFNAGKTARRQLNLHYHLVLTLDKSLPAADETSRKEFYKYIVGCVQATGGKAEGIGGTQNKVHLLVGLNTNHHLADFVRSVKLVSSVLVKRQMKMSDFKWCEEYEAFTVSLSQRESVRRYIVRQEQHHNQFGTGEDYNSSWQRNAVESSELY
jgi:putative transposase